MRFSIHLVLFFLSSLTTNFDISVEAAVNPFSPQASLRRHWTRSLSYNHIPSILLSKASPLNASQVAIFSHCMDAGTLPSQILSFCSAAKLFCDLNDSRDAVHNNTAANADFMNYSNNQFKKYPKDSVLGGDSFKNYSLGENVGHDSFGQYGQDGIGASEEFANYAADTNVGVSSFTGYATESNGETAGFRSYGLRGNVQGHQFKNYASASSAATQTFSYYSDGSNVAKNGFRSYSTDANGVFSQFSAYSGRSNVAKNEFKSYDKAANGALELFANYANSSNAAHNEFQAYDSTANAGIEQFMRYGGDGTNLAENVFRSYGKGTNSPVEIFTSYGDSSGPSTTKFIEYGKGALGDPQSQFSTYSRNSTSFKEYSRSSTRFSEYINTTSAPGSRLAVEPGKFFRQEDLIAGKQIPMPDIRDKMPRRSFLPRALADRLPFNSSELPNLVELLHAQSMQMAMKRTVSECERPAAKGETKRCVTSIEGMVEFAASMIGRAAIVSTTASTAGAGRMVVVGKIDGGKERRVVSCHQSMFPYLVYYCHAVPRVVVYDVELMVVEEKSLNRGVAVCHLDTAEWSAGHEAFVALGHAPGQIEVCHWIYPNDFVWRAHHQLG